MVVGVERGSTRASDRGRSPSLTLPGLLLGLGLGGFVDGIVLHQILQWHHMLTDFGDDSTQRTLSVPALEDNTFWDGIFHAGSWVLVLVGLALLWRALASGRRTTWRSLTGLLLAGWGTFNLVEGIVDHHILTLHHVRDDVADPMWWDLGFLAVGLLLLIGGLALRRSDVRASESVARSRPVATGQGPAV